MSRSNSSSSSLVFRAFAVVVAISVVGYLVYSAQQRAEPQQPVQQPAQGPEGASPEPSLEDLGPVLLPSSKDAVLPSSKFDVLKEPLLFSSKSGRVPVQEEQQVPLLPSSKVIVIPDDATKAHMRKLAEEFDKQKKGKGGKSGKSDKGGKQ